jgi:hypothetical protein
MPLSKPSLPRVLTGATLVTCAGAVLLAHSVPAAPKPDGAKIYAKHCASCHGAKGEGSKAYAKALTGDKPVSQLAVLISKTMPPNNPKAVVGDNARSVAAYIYDAFYSPIAQVRNKPPRVELARMTAVQYRNAVADLIGSFRRTPPPADERRGLLGVYYKTRPQRDQRILERVDPEIRFDFQTAGALPEQNDPYQFSMRWNGSIVPPDSGDYEFIIRTEHAMQFWVNDLRTPLIDARVKSGDMNEYRATIRLLGGRRYPVQLEFSKGVQGVNDLKKLKEKPPAKASLVMEWKPPKRTAEVVPARALLPVSGPEVFVLTAPFPPDDRSMGYERGTSVSKEWEEATTEAAIETARYVADHLRELSGVADNAPDRVAKLKEFCRTFVTRAFRRPLTPELATTYVDRHFEEAPDPETAVKRVVLLALKSPRFLYLDLEGPGAADPYQVATRLSFGLWDSLPDQELLRAAGAGELSTREQVAKQAERMVADPRTRAKVRDFFLHWLKVEQYPDLMKDPKRFPDFDEKVASDLRTSLELTLDDVIWSEKSDFRELLLSDQVYLNGRLAKIYGANLPEDAPFQKVSLDPAARAGVLTHPYVLASFAYLDASSPIHRGVLLTRNVLGRVLQPPNEAFTPLSADLHPNLTTRERVALQTSPKACASCHEMINGLGFSLEHFDAIGRFRTKENGKPIDASGVYQSRDGKPVKFTGARDLANYLARSAEPRSAIVEKLFQHLVKQPIRAFGAEAVADLERRFEANGYSIRKQLVESVTVAALGAPPQRQAKRE